MRLPKAFSAVALFIALPLLTCSIALAGGNSGKDNAAPAPSVTQEAQGEAAPGQSLGELLGRGAAGQKALVSTGVWALSRDEEVYSNTCLEQGATLYLRGHTLTVHGDLTLSGTLAVNGGKLFVIGNFIMDRGLLVMTDPSDCVEVDGAMIAGGADETGSLAAGRVTISGDFVQLNTYSDKSYNETGTHTTALGGPDRLVQFFSPAGSAIRNPNFAAGTTFTSADRTIGYQYTYVDADGSIKVLPRSLNATGGTFLSLSNALVSDYSIDVPHLYYSGDQQGRSLTVGGSLIVPQGSGITPTGNWYAARLIVNGTLAISDPGREIKATDLISVQGALHLGAGAVATKDFDAYGAVDIGGGALSVSGSYIRHASPEERSLTVSAAGSPVTIEKDTALRFAIGPSGANLSGYLGGRRVTAQGALTVPAGAALTVDGGRLDVQGDMTVLGALSMSVHTDAVVVNGKFTWGGSASGSMTDGYLALAGNIEQTGGSSFNPAGNHKTLLYGTGIRSILLANPGSAFANLYSLNPDVDVESGFLSATGEKANTGTGLSGLEVDSGTLALYPAFGGATLAYEAVVPEDTSSVTVTPATVGDVTMYVNGVAQTGNIGVPQDATTKVQISAASKAGEPYPCAGAPFSAVYTLTLQPENSKLASPGFSYSMDHPFNPTTTDYAVTVPAKDEQLSLSPVLANPNAAFAFVCGGQPYSGAAFTHGIAPGQTIEVDVVVTAYVNPTVPSPITRTYRFTFRRQTLLDGIALSGGLPLNEPFSRDRADYTADIPASAWAVTVTPAKGDGCASLTINGAAANSVEFRPDFGGSTKADITVADNTGTYGRTYSVTVRRPALLTNIPVTAAIGTDTIGCALAPAFSSAVHAYSSDVPVNADVITVSGDKVLPGCTGLTVGGQPDACHPSIAPGGYWDIALIASAGSAPEQRATYTVRVGRPLVSGLSTSAGSFVAPFSPDPSVPSSVTLPYAEPFAVLTPTANDRGAGLVTFAYYEGGTPLGTGQNILVALAQGQTRTITVAASYQGTEKRYTVAVSREKSDNADLSSMGVNNGWLSPAFSSDTTEYTLLLPETVSSVKLAPARADGNAAYRIDSLASNTPKTVSLALNKSATVKIAVTALRGNGKTYTVTVRRTSIVSSFSASPFYAGYPSLSPGGTDRMILSYKLTIPATVRLLVRKGGVWYTVLSRAETSNGTKTYTWDGKVKGRFLGAGAYTVRVVPYWKGAAGTPKDLRVKIFGRPGVSFTYLSPAAFKPNGTAKLTVKVKWTRLCDIKAEVVDKNGKVIKQLYLAQNKAPATKTLYWDGTNAAGALAPAGAYKIKVTCGGASPAYKSFTVKR